MKYYWDKDLPGEGNLDYEDIYYELGEISADLDAHIVDLSLKYYF